MLAVTGLISAAGKEKFRCPNMLSLVSFAGMTLNKCTVLHQDVNWRPPVQGESSPVQVQEPYSSLHDYYWLSSCKTGVYNVHLLIILERIANTDICKCSFPPPKTIRHWNALPDSLISSAEGADDG